MARALHLVSFISFFFGTPLQFNFFNSCIEVTYKSLHIFNVYNLINLDKYPSSFNLHNSLMRKVPFISIF